jgi:hypothetical protein
MSGNLIQSNAIQIPLRDESVQLCCFSPPYFGLRKYKIRDIQFPDGWTGQLGLEKSIECEAEFMELRDDLTEKEKDFVYKELKRKGLL